MRKLLVIITVLMLSGCMAFTNTTQENQRKYEAYYQAILDRDVFTDQSHFFSLTSTITKTVEGYRYNIVVDHPLIAMYNVEMMAIEDYGAVSINKDKAMPTIGIFDELNYNLLPYQVNVSTGYPAGLILDGLSDQPKIPLMIMVVWSDVTGTKNYREFYQILLEYKEN